LPCAALMCSGVIGILATVQGDDDPPGKVQQVSFDLSASSSADVGDHVWAAVVICPEQNCCNSIQLMATVCLLQTIRQHAARVRDTNAAESSSAMGISMQSVAQGLRLGQFDCLADVDIAIEAACSTGLHTFLDQNPEGAGSPEQTVACSTFLCTRRRR
jgi:hypothetical protein